MSGSGTTGTAKPGAEPGNADAKRAPTIVVVNREGRRIEVEGIVGLSLMENIRHVEAGVEAICGGMCACATCHVYLDADVGAQVPPRSFEETVMLADEPAYDAERSRLSCQIRLNDALDGIVLTVAPKA